MTATVEQAKSLNLLQKELSELITQKWRIEDKMGVVKTKIEDIKKEIKDAEIKNLTELRKEVANWVCDSSLGSREGYVFYKVEEGTVAYDKEEQEINYFCGGKCYKYEKRFLEDVLDEIKRDAYNSKNRLREQWLEDCEYNYNNLGLEEWLDGILLECQDKEQLLEDESRFQFELDIPEYEKDTEYFVLTETIQLEEHVL